MSFISRPVFRSWLQIIAGSESLLGGREGWKEMDGWSTEVALGRGSMLWEGALFGQTPRLSVFSKGLQSQLCA